MKNPDQTNPRRSFLKKGIALSTGLGGLGYLGNSALANPKPASEDLLVIGPRSGGQMRIIRDRAPSKTK